ncbi:MAG: MFS transporter [Chloroflexota bacterium]
MRADAGVKGAVQQGIDFIGRQPTDWKVSAARTSIFRFFYQMLLPYLSIYTLALGATGTQLGIVNSVGMGVAGLIAPMTGWIIDRFGNKRVYLVGIVLLAVSWLIYGVAQSWPIIIVAMLAYWIGFRTSIHSCAVVCGNSLATVDRATAMSCCESLAAGILGMAGPMLGALLVAYFGGLNVDSIRPLFFITLAGTVFTFFLVLTRLSDRRWPQADATAGFRQGLLEIYRQGKGIRRFIGISVVAYLPLGMIIPYTQPFANEFKGADEIVLGVMVTAFALTPLVLGIPLGRMADRHGRKKVLFAIAPLFWLSSLLLIWAPNPLFLIIASALQGFFFINQVITAAMQFELVPAEHMAKWVGIIAFFRMSLAALTAFLAGLIWDSIGPQYIFLALIALDILIRIPLLIGMPETLTARQS